MLSRSRRLAECAQAAMLSAIEVYNKPNFAYREETFAILALNAWELILKARLLAQNRNSLKCLWVYEPRKNKAGRTSTKKYVRKNRSGNPFTIGLTKAVTLLDASGGALPEAVKRNLDALTEIRDNAVHYINASPVLAKRVLEIGTACLLNFIEVAKKWFGLDLGGYNLYLFPIGFVQSPQSSAVVAAHPEDKKLLEYLASLVQEAQDSPDDGYHVSLGVRLSFLRSSAGAATTVAVTNDPSAPKVQIAETDVRQQYPWDYSELLIRLKQRYTDFKPTAKFHAARKPLLDDQRYAHRRYLDPGNLNSSSKVYYNPNILMQFDPLYTRK